MTEARIRITDVPAALTRAEPDRLVPAGGALSHLLERAVWVTDDGVALVHGHEILWANPALHSICGRPADSLVGADASTVAIAPLEDGPGPRVSSLVEVVDVAGGSLRVALRRNDGSVVAVQVVVTRVHGTPDGPVVIRLREINEHIRVDEALRSSEARFRALSDNAPIGVCLSEVGARLGYVNSRFAVTWGQPGEDLLGDRWLNAVVPDDLPGLLAAVGRALAGEEAAVLAQVQRPDGSVRTLSVRLVPVVGADRQAAFIGSVEDVTDTRAREAELAWQARHDALTGLPNRTELWDRLRHLLSDHRGVALLFFDLDDFKLVNDSMGHAAGDTLLRAIAHRLSDAVRGDDIVARFGGDEFVVLCADVKEDAHATALAERLLEVVREPVDLGRRSLRVTASVGVLVAGEDLRDPENLIRDADVAMYQAKTAGKARAALFDSAARRRIEHRLDVVSDLRRALAEGDVGVHYQPIIRADGLQVVGAEALLRYEHSTLGPIPAGQLIEAAEASGCIDDLGGYVLERACRDLAAWRRRTGGWRPDYVSVNLAASQLADPGFPARVHEALRASGLSGDSLCLELTESQLMTDVESASSVLDRLAGDGVRLAIDDFGTGYSSLAYLRQFPVSLVKIERSFVADPDEPYIEAIIEAVVAVTRAVGGQVVAEGVETLAQLETVRALGCSLIQGYLLGRPSPASELPVIQTCGPLAQAC